MVISFLTKNKTRTNSNIHTDVKLHRSNEKFFKNKCVDRGS